MNQAPSIALTVWPASSEQAAIGQLDAAFRRGHRRLAGVAPRGLRYPDWLGGFLGVDRSTGLAWWLPEDVSRVFHDACRISAALGETPLAAFRRFQGGAPVAKFFTEGVPRFKDGDDPDHEVHFRVPPGAPVDLRWAPPSEMPTSAATFLSTCPVQPLPFAAGGLGASGRRLDYVDKRSRYA